MGYQGLFPPDILPAAQFALGPVYDVKKEFFGQVNFLKGAWLLPISSPP